MLDDFFGMIKEALRRIEILEQKKSGSGNGSSLPDQTDHSGEFLTTDGTNSRWSSVGSNSFVANEIPNGAVNGSNVTFTLVNMPVSGSLLLFRDGQLLKGDGEDYSLSTSTITFTTAPVLGSVLLATYQHSVATSGNADTLDGEHLSGILSLVYPIGAIFTSINNVNPSTLFGGTWVAWGTGKVPVGVDTAQTEFNTVEKTGGHKLLQAHKHTIYNQNTTQGLAGGSPGTGDGGRWGFQDINDNTMTAFFEAGTTGGGNAENLQPYITCYMWKRTA